MNNLFVLPMPDPAAPLIPAARYSEDTRQSLSVNVRTVRNTIQDMERRGAGPVRIVNAKRRECELAKSGLRLKANSAPA